MEDKQAHGTLTRYAMAANYTEAVEAAGGVPLVIPPQVGNIEDILAVVDGLLLSGGADVAPQLYGDTEVHETTYGIHAGRDELELGLIRKAVERDMPMLCICRGIQVLNVALGGTLIQDVPSQYSSDIVHAQAKAGIPAAEPGHTVAVTPGTLLAETYGQETIEVNSFHHQAVRDVAPGLVVNGIAPDETIEAVSRPEGGWILGVQWHPEMMFRAHPEHLKPFSALIAEAAKRKSAAAV